MTIEVMSVVKCRGRTLNSDSGANGHPFILLHKVGQEYLGVVCTSSENKQNFSEFVEIDYTSAGLPKPTIVITSKVAIINASKIKSTYGKITQNEYIEIISKLIDDKGLSNMKENLEDVLYE